jgi:hypothetical protein
MTVSYDDAAREVVAFHEFLADFFNARGHSAPADVIAHLTAFDDDFVVVSPDGSIQAVSQLRAWLETGRGGQPGKEIDIENMQLRHLGADFLILTYHEVQKLPDRTTRRLSSATFARADAAPLGVKWLHLHECWLEN